MKHIFIFIVQIYNILMEKNEIIQYIYDLNFVDSYVRKLANSSQWPQIEDCIQEIYLQLLEVPQEKWDNLLSQGTKADSFKAVRGYISGVIYRNIKSVNSKVYYKLFKHNEKEIAVGDTYADLETYE